MNIRNLSRREILRILLLISLGGLTGCSKPVEKLRISGVKGSLPRELLRNLPSSWEFKSIYPGKEKTYLNSSLLIESELIAIEDGWLSSFSGQQLYDFDLEPYLQNFDAKAIEFLNGLGDTFDRKVLPIGVSPWIMLFRNGDKWLKEATISWDILLDHTLKDLIILPESPRVIMSIAENISDPFALNKLRQQCKIFDDRNAINWLVSGHAKVAVLPLNRCWRILSQDSRLRTILPESGAPLNWSLLIQSKKIDSSLIPKSWIKDSWELPLLPFLLARGWTPPLPLNKLRESTSFTLEKNQSRLIPSNLTWERCWSLPSLTLNEKIRLEAKWRDSS